MVPKNFFSIVYRKLADYKKVWPRLESGLVWALKTKNNLVPRVFRLFGQRGNAGKTLGTSNFITAGFLR